MKLSSCWIVIAALGLFETTANADALLRFTDRKSYIRSGAVEYTFEGGSLDLTVVDGDALIAGCAYNGSPVRAFPDMFCPLGTTGFIVAGDVDGDGERDSGTYWSIATLQRATNVAPGQTARISMIAAPPSQLPRPMTGAGWTDTGIIIWYNSLAPPISEFEITRYSFSRPYLPNQLQKQFDEIVPGTYQFLFPLQNDPQDLFYFPIRITHQPIIEATPGRGHIQQAGDWRGLNDEDWKEDLLGNQGALEVDPRLFYRFRWRGFEFSPILGGDQTFFSMLDPDTEQVIYPPYDPIVPDGERFPELISTPSTFFDLGPNFFLPGDEAIAQISFQRNFSSTGNSRDNSERLFRWPVRFVETYDGFALTGFPAGSNESLWVASADFDGDGWTNIEEFGLQTDPSDAADAPVFDPTLDPVTGQYLVDIQKRPNGGFSLEYAIEYSTDMVNYTRLRPGDPNWLIEFDNPTSLRVRSIQVHPDVKYFIRPVIIQN